MGYHVTILKTEDGRTIPLSKSVVQSTLYKFPELSLEGESVNRNNQNFLIFKDGGLWLSNPTTEELSIMIQLASAMHARVRGDEFETYLSVNNTYHHPDDLQFILHAKNQLLAIKKSSSKRAFALHSLVIGGFIFLILLFYALGWLK